MGLKKTIKKFLHSTDRHCSANAQANMPPRITWIFFIVILLMNLWLSRTLAPEQTTPLTVPYTLFREEVAKGNVERIFGRGETITGSFRKAITYPTPDKTESDPEAVLKKADRSQGVTEPPAHRIFSRRSCPHSPIPVWNHFSSATMWK